MKDKDNQYLQKAQKKIKNRFLLKKTLFYFRQIALAAFTFVLLAIPLNSAYMIIERVMMNPHLNSLQLWNVNKTILINLITFIITGIVGGLFIIFKLDWSYDKHIKRIENRNQNAFWYLYKKDHLKRDAKTLAASLKDDHDQKMQEKKQFKKLKDKAKREKELKKQQKLNKKVTDVKPKNKSKK